VHGLPQLRVSAGNPVTLAGIPGYSGPRFQDSGLSCALS
jgi:hypothetical protein